MATPKVAQILRVRGDFSSEQIDRMSDHEAWNWIYEQDHQTRQNSALAKPQICFTGFSATDRKHLETRANSLNLEVKPSVTKALRYLCVGPDAGPSKIVKAQDQGTTILTGEQFQAFCLAGKFNH